MLERDVLPKTYFDRTDTKPSEQAASRLYSSTYYVRRLLQPLILVCGHGARDSRCGVMGPLLLEQFDATCKDLNISFRSALITHIGGHKFAGNVIVYVPPIRAFQGNSLAGMGIWYGRVEPRHVPGIVRETLGKGRIVRELYRGSMSAGEDPEAWLQWRVGLREARDRRKEKARRKQDDSKGAVSSASSAQTHSWQAET